MNALIRSRTLAPVLALAACTLTTAAHACPSTAPGRFVVNAAGDEVTDTHTGLIWKRCSEGLSWNASTQSCDGKLSRRTLMTHEQAMAHAQAQGGGWRVPSVEELQTLVDRACHDPAIDSSLFTVSTGYSYWTSTPRAGDPTGAWDVSFSVGAVDVAHRDKLLAVLLVRTSR